jgi:hypothetical protein
VWGQLSLETMQAARGIGFRFFFASGTLLCYLWSAPKSSSRPAWQRAFSIFCSIAQTSGTEREKRCWVSSPEGRYRAKWRAAARATAGLLPSTPSLGRNECSASAGP